MIKRSKTPQVFFVLAALTLTAGAVGSFFQYQEISDQQEMVKELEKDARDTKDIQADLDLTNESVATSKVELNHLEKSVPAFAYVPTLLRELELFGKEHGIDVLGVRPIPKVEPKDKSGRPKKKAYEELAIEVKGRGLFKNVQAFVEALQKFPKIVGARAVSLTPKNEPGETKGKTLDVTIELRTFLFPPAEDELIDPSALAGSPKPAVNSQNPSADSVKAPVAPTARKGGQR